MPHTRLEHEFKWLSQAIPAPPRWSRHDTYPCLFMTYHCRSRRPSCRPPTTTICDRSVHRRHSIAPRGHALKPAANPLPSLRLRMTKTRGGSKATTRAKAAILLGHCEARKGRKHIA
ncbi:hypothetical protein CTA1_11632 [Colletotrichum tanaceti]|uniref:Uncharacterized protein n=1 Tax=Colletotrichum tanaceti TaxID=1306861 RepID=A0A4V6DI41_9PEZI|nr:hypothetical protein CTA1_11632 [Colletotrichum tanaceti]